ncbi:Nuclease SbcCD subunit C [Carpediemonas membranifera]|uniref:Nuclease SbcCD subunit C n=1 Tax=Carpediemonas membranifera TaxID=201153 RepID=A0A8J6E4X1_9EUKA|nr:Nuclease SbcCD subunit C [Carpediemonas membranifera]|eukprot:KAG9397466.1 Nuclease SbcCD subunit C [Carpediemonas membranifera]
MRSSAKQQTGTKQPVRLKISDLVQLCASCDVMMVKSLRIDEYLDNNNVTDEDDRQFITQTLYGLEQHEDLLKKTLQMYLESVPTALPTDGPVYRVMIYWIAFRLEEMGMKQLIRLIRTQGSPKALSFIRFFTDRENEARIAEAWEQFYDRTHTREVMLGDLYRLAEEAQADIDALISAVEQPAMTGTVDVPKEAKTTRPEPFNITQPAPRALPEPEVLSTDFKSLDVPSYDDHKKIAKKLEKAKMERKPVVPKAPKLSAVNRPSKTQRLKEQLAEAEAAPAPFKSRPVPPPPKATVRLNATAILREDALYRKRIREEADMLQKYEQELRDGRSFEQWREEQLKADAEKEAVLIAQRKADSAAAFEDARESRLLDLLKKQEDVADMQAALAEQKNISEEERAKEAARLKAKAARLQQKIKEGTKKAAEAVLEENRKKSDVVKKENEELRARVEAEREAERKQREDLIRQIRALEKVPRPDIGREFDPATSSGQGFLNEMSLVELKERLVIMKEIEEAEEERKREAIKEAKRAKESELLGKASRIKKYRQAAHVAARKERESKVSSRASTASMIEQKRMQSAAQVQTRLDAKREKRREEALKLAAAAREKREHAKKLNEEARQTKQRWYRDLSHNAEKKLVQLEHERNGGREAEAVARQRDEANLKAYRQMQDDERAAKKEAADALLEEQRAAAEEARMLEATANAEKMEKVRSIKAAARQKLEDTQPYTAMMLEETRRTGTVAVD